MLNIRNIRKYCSDIYDIYRYYMLAKCYDSVIMYKSLNLINEYLIMFRIYIRRFIISNISILLMLIICIIMCRTYVISYNSIFV